MFKETQNPKEFYNEVFHSGSVYALTVWELVKKKACSSKTRKIFLPVLLSMINPVAQSPTEIKDKLNL